MPDTIERLLAWPELKRVVPYTRTHLSRLERRGDFPARVQVGPGRVAWKASEVSAWIEGRERAQLALLRGVRADTHAAAE
jgi:prophage regulatory protein